jgi:hypothetical protein
VSPILVRPVREQLEHDRVIRLLQARYRRRFLPGINPGGEQTTSVGTAPGLLYPDLVLTATGGSKKIAGIVEVETGESVNTLEALAQWVPFGRLPIAFSLYVPASAVEVSKRLCADHRVGVTEIWTYHMVGDQIRFTQIYRSPIEAKLSAARAAAAEARRAATPQATRTAAKPAMKAAKKPAVKATKKPAVHAAKKAAPAKRIAAPATKKASPAKPVVRTPARKAR